MKKILKLVMLFVLAMVLLVGCTTATKDEPTPPAEQPSEQPTEQPVEESVTIEMLVPGYDTGYLTEQIDNNIKKFEEAYPNVKVSIIPAGWDELNSKVVQLYQAGKAPDIMMIGSRSLRQFAEMGIIEDLTPYLNNEFLAERIDNVMDTAKINGKQYGIPMAFSSRALFYRSDLIETPPTNWEELLATAKAVAAKENIHGFAIPTDITSGTDEILNFIYQGGGRMVDEKGDFTINSQENIDTLIYLEQFKDVIPDPVGTTRSDQVQMFINGDLAMFISGAWEQGELDKNIDKTPYAVAKLPQGKQEAVTLVSDSYAISSISDNKEEAFKFIEFMGKPEQQRPISEAYNWFPVTKAEQDDERFKTDFLKPFMEITVNGISEPPVPNWDEFNKSFVIAVQKVLTGNASPKDALDTAQQENQK